MWIRLCVQGKRLNLQTIGNPSVRLSFTLTKNENVEYCIKIKIHNPIVLKFWVESNVNDLYLVPMYHHSY